MIFTVPTNTESSSFDGREAKSNGFAQSGGIDMRYTILITHSTIRVIKPLPRDVPIRIWRIVRIQPKKRGGQERKDKKET